MALPEFSMIERLRRRNPVSRPDVVLGIGDDAALTSVPAGVELVLAVDTLVEGVHFPANAAASDIGYRVLAVNLSDLAAMGAEPAWATLALTLPEADTGWLDSFADGFFGLAEQHNVQLIGGDTTRGPLTVSVQIQGLVPAGEALRRKGARPGDHILVTGTLGDAAMGLWCVEHNENPASINRDFVIGRLAHPEPRVRAGQALRGLASACIDVSDGLLADLGHILAAAGAGAVIEVDRVPVSAEYDHLWETVCERIAHDRYQWPLAGGDDYELCFTASPEIVPGMIKCLEAVGTPCTDIGTVEPGSGIRCIRDDGAAYTPQQTGFRHF